MTGLKLNLGAAHTRIPGFVNVDIAEHADVSLDLGRDPLPFDDGSASLVFSHHTLEHVPDHLFALAEIHRVLEHDGILLLGLPYVTLTEFNLVNPYHLHRFSEHSFAFFEPGGLKGSAAEDSPISFVKAFHRFYYLGAFGLLPGPLREWSRRHLFNVVRAFDVGLVAVKDPERPVERGAERARDMEEEFDRLLASRLPYRAGGAAPAARRRSGFGRRKSRLRGR